MLKPVEKQRVADEIVEQLRGLILKGTYPPGSKLPPERELSRSLGVNRASLREALKRLEHEGLVVIRQGDGTRVTNFMETAGIDLVAHLIPVAGSALPELVRDVLEFRRIYGRELARLAALRADEENLDRIADVAARSAAQTEDGADLFLLDFEFYVALSAASKNRMMVLMTNTVRAQVQKYAPLMWPVIGSGAIVREHHQALLAAVRERDGERAAAIADAYLAQGIEQTTSLVDAGRQTLVKGETEA